MSGILTRIRALSKYPTLKKIPRGSFVFENRKTAFKTIYV
jgi:hypothetical protein